MLANSLIVWSEGGKTEATLRHSPRGAGSSLAVNAVPARRGRLHKRALAGRGLAAGFRERRLGFGRWVSRARAFRGQDLVDRTCEDGTQQQGAGR